MGIGIAGAVKSFNILILRVLKIGSATEFEQAYLPLSDSWLTKEGTAASARMQIVQHLIYSLYRASHCRKPVFAVVPMEKSC